MLRKYIVQKRKEKKTELLTFNQLHNTAIHCTLYKCRTETALVAVVEKPRDAPYQLKMLRSSFCMTAGNETCCGLCQ